ncbi:hypothetical protein AB0L34_15670 [Micromonospora sp. NPDC052213]|uniref:hypothetical protein n=1 Tax=Micromonospora sp. NPDC052213 TaxID=3155812 RepID=UPI00342A1840
MGPGVGVGSAGGGETVLVGSADGPGVGEPVAVITGDGLGEGVGSGEGDVDGLGDGLGEGSGTGRPPGGRDGTTAGGGGGAGRTTDPGPGAATTGVRGAGAAGRQVLGVATAGDGVDGATPGWFVAGTGITTGPTEGVGRNGVPLSGRAVLPTVAEPVLIAARIGIDAVPASSATVNR